MTLSRRELYAWISLASGLALSGYYVVAIIGVPAADLGSWEGPLLEVVVLAFLAELTLGFLQQGGPDRVESDERDTSIAARGFRNAYYFSISALMILLFYVGTKPFLQTAVGDTSVVHVPAVTFHAIVLIILIAGTVNAGTRLLGYFRGA